MRSQTPFESVMESAIFLTSSYCDSMILPSSSHLVTVSTELATAFFSANVKDFVTDTAESPLDGFPKDRLGVITSPVLESIMGVFMTSSFLT